MIKNVLVIGGSGGIANALVDQLCQLEGIEQVHVVSRSFKPESMQSRVTWHTLDSLDHHSVLKVIECWEAADTTFQLVVSTVGVLHGDNVQPEKRLEDIDINAFRSYFDINTMINAQWLKFSPRIIDKQGATIVVFSARVGSISDNRLGGWYGYRASKSALNMLMKTASVEFARRFKNTNLVCYHPGTVDTRLSKPFQSNVKPEKLFTPEFTVSQLLSILPELSVSPNMHYIDWQGKSIPW